MQKSVPPFERKKRGAVKNPGIPFFAAIKGIIQEESVNSLTAICQQLSKYRKLRRKSGLSMQDKPLHNSLSILLTERVAYATLVVNLTRRFCYDLQLPAYSTNARMEAIFGWNIIFAPYFPVKLFRFEYLIGM